MSTQSSASAAGLVHDAREARDARRVAAHDGARQLRRREHRVDVGARARSADGGRIKNPGESLLKIVAADAKGAEHNISSNFQVCFDLQIPTQRRPIHAQQVPGFMSNPNIPPAQTYHL